MECYITRTGSYLPGPAVENDQIERYLGSIDGEASVKERLLSMNGIKSRHYAQDHNQNATHDVYQLAQCAVSACITAEQTERIGMLSAGTTYAPLAAPGIGSILHERLKNASLIHGPIEISSHAGVCSSSSAAFVGAVRAIKSGQHSSALAVGAEHASQVLKSTMIQPIDDRSDHNNIRNSKWFMSVFLRFMLSDGAGAFLLSDAPEMGRMSLRVDWTHSMSFAHAAPLCMSLKNSNGLLSQDVTVLSRYLFPTARKAVASALENNGEVMDDYRCVLPHMSSFFFRRKMEKMIAEFCADRDRPVPYWTNLATAGNTGAASIYIMLDHFIREQPLSEGERLILFVPESGQFNFVLISLTAVRA